MVVLNTLTNVLWQKKNNFPLFVSQPISENKLLSAINNFFFQDFFGVLFKRKFQQWFPEMCFVSNYEIFKIYWELPCGTIVFRFLVYIICFFLNKIHWQMFCDSKSIFQFFFISFFQETKCCQLQLWKTKNNSSWLLWSFYWTIHFIIDF